MKKIIVVLIAFLIVAFVFVTMATRVATQNAENEVPTINVKASSLETTVNGQFIVQLDSNPTTGFSWGTSYDKDALELVASTFIPPSDTKLLGSGGMDTFTFKALKAGETKLKFSYLRAWESVQPQEVKEYTVSVKEASAKN
ncbi:MAG: protease inhibitor I42 family protein [Candidatus Jorgensenbacteria bacterium]|nr:protease inhibitor I42 family protein [Candidatus Jorgensenbacteria bacterium]